MLDLNVNIYITKVVRFGILNQNPNWNHFDLTTAWLFANVKNGTIFFIIIFFLFFFSLLWLFSHFSFSCYAMFLICKLIMQRCHHYLIYTHLQIYVISFFSFFAFPPRTIDNKGFEGSTYQNI